MIEPRPTRATDRRPPSQTGDVTFTGKLYRSRVFAFFLLSTLAAVVTFIWAAAVEGTAAIVLFGVGSSLVASIVFSTGQMLMANQAFEELVDRTVRQAANETSDRFMQKIQQDQLEYLPIEEFDASTVPSVRFNGDLTAELSQSQRYLFFGLTGRYVGPRLHRLDHRLSDVTIIVGDPSHDETVRTRVQRLQPAATEIASGFESVRQTLFDELDLCIVGCFLERLRHDRITICVIPAPTLDRFEIVDSAIYLSLFSDRHNRTTTFPRALKFANRSAIYQTSQRAAYRAADAPEVISLRITSNTEFEDLKMFYEETFGRELTETEFEAITANYIAFTSDFYREARLSTADGLAAVRAIVSGGGND